MTTIEKPFKVLYKTAHDEHIVEEFDTASDALDYGLAYYTHLSEGDRETVTIMVVEVTEDYAACGDIESIIWNSDEQTVPDERMPQYMIDKGLMPWEEEEIRDATIEVGAWHDDITIRALMAEMEAMLEGDAYMHAVEHARQMAQESAGALYDGGWRASDRDELAEEYRLTPMELDALVKALEDIEGDGE